MRIKPPVSSIKVPANPPSTTWSRNKYLQVISYLEADMIRALSILLSALVLMQSLHITPADLVKLDELLEHARYHQQQFGDDFATFLSKHYGDDKEEHSRQHSEEREQHEQLPFQQLVHLGGAHNFILKKPVFHLYWTPDSPKQANNFHYLNSHTSEFKSGIFQPPRQA